MPLLETPNTQPTTTADKQAAVSLAIRKNTSQLFSEMVRTHGRLATRVFASRIGLTPQEVFDGLGSDGAELVQLAALLTQTVNAAAPGTLPATLPFVLTVDGGGNVTVGEAV